VQQALLIEFRRGDSIDPPPGADDRLDVGSRPCSCDIKKLCLVIGRRDSRDGPDLRVRQLAVLHCCADARQAGKRVRNADLLSRGAEIDAGPPAEPVCTGPEAVAPDARGIELAQEDEQLVRRGVQPRGELGDRLTELFTRCRARGSE